MRRVSALWVGVALAAVAAPLRAQEPQCQTIDPSATTACNTAVDAVRAFHPLAGLIISGGNPVLGLGGTLGGFGHLALTARVNAVKLSLPNPDSASQSSVPSSFSGAVPAPLVEASVGLLRGTGAGLLSIDALGSAVLLPTGAVSDLTVDSSAAKIGSIALGLGYGARIGLLKGSFPIPAVSISLMRRNLPRIQYGQLAPACCSGDQFEFDTDLHATSVRVAAGLSVVALDLAAGFGFDTYTSSANIRFYDSPPTLSVRDVKLDLHNSRQVVFLDAGLSLALLKLVAEIGYQTGKDQHLSTNFSGFDPTSGHVFGGAGLRFGI